MQIVWGKDTFYIFNSYRVIKKRREKNHSKRIEIVLSCTQLACDYESLLLDKAEGKEEELITGIWH